MRIIGENIAKPNKTMPKCHPWNLAKSSLGLFSLLFHTEISNSMLPLEIILLNFEYLYSVQGWIYHGFALN